MDAVTEKRLKQAEEYFYSCRLVEAYNILRRYFDRIPFKLEPGHAKYIGFFTRVLLEMGKTHELDFYIAELEKHYSQLNTPEVTYQLGMVFLSKGDFNQAKEKFEETIRNPNGQGYHVKAKMCLMRYYEIKKDYIACRLLLDSIPPQPDAMTKTLLDIWRANILRYEGNLDASDAILNELRERVTFEANWYEYVYVRFIQAWVQLDRKNYVEASQIIEEVKLRVESKRSKTVNIILDELKAALAERTSIGHIEYYSDDSRAGYIVKYLGKSVHLKRSNPKEKLFMLFLKHRFLEKDVIVNTLCDREYVPKVDDRLIYSQIHSLRKQFKSLGLPKNVICSENNGYRLVPTVKRIRGIA
ncbi:MAG: helix-turn-helix domain-containing protein [Bdellovibrionaceae bacterium]|nr:helix-turn-helix domain-containing protein [Pseudobdellovibrionaceae bacterium]